MPLTIVAGSDTVTFLDPVDGFTGIAGAYWISKAVGERQYAKEKAGSPGTDGVRVSRHGFRGLPIGPIVVYYVATTEAGCINLFVADRAKIENKSVTVSIPNWPATFVASDVLSFKPGIPHKSDGAFYRMRCEINVVQDRLS